MLRWIAHWAMNHAPSPEKQAERALNELRMELDMMYYVFRQGDGVEGIRALAVDKDHAPKWQPARLDEVTRERVHAFFDSPWAHGEHPLAAL